MVYSRAAVEVSSKKGDWGLDASHHTRSSREAGRFRPLTFYSTLNLLVFIDLPLYPS